MKTNGLNIIGFIAFVITIAIIAGSFQLIRSGLSGEEGNWLPSGQLQEEGVERFDGSVKDLKLNTVAGAIEVEYWNESDIEISWQKWGSEAVKEKIEVIIEQRGNSVTAEVKHPKGFSGFRGWVSFTVKIPSTLEGLQAGSVSGSIEILGPTDKLAAIDQELKTTSGSVYTEGADNLGVSSVSGSLRFRAAGPKVEGSTTSGSIKGSILNPETDKINLSSVSGSVTLGLPEEWTGSVTMKSVSGSLTSDMPLMVESQSRSRLTGRIGDGGGDADLKTTSGRISIEQGDVL